MRVTRRGCTRIPPLANGAYAVTSSSGVTSSAPSAIDGMRLQLARDAVAMRGRDDVGFADARLTRTVAAFDENISARRSVMRP